MDYAPIEAFLVGRCGMTVEQAGWATAREYELRRKGYDEAEQEKWERARWKMFLAMQMQPFVKSHSKPKTPQAWIRFPWEKKVGEVTKEDCLVREDEVAQLNRLLRDFKSRMQKKK